MANKPRLISYKAHVHASPSAVYRALTKSTALREWLGDVATTEPKKGGRFFVGWNDGYYASGEFASLTPDAKVAIAWHGRGEPNATQVQFIITLKNGLTQVQVKHTGLGGAKTWAKHARALERLWQGAMENLVSVLETGVDLRIALRPMLGIILGDFSTARAAELGVPVAEGVRIDKPIEGMGAHTAGLGHDDVVVSLGGKKVTGFQSLGAALQGKRGGDVVSVGFYRGREKKSVSMELSRRPLPAIPDSAAELAATLSMQYDEQSKALDACLAGVTEAEAAFRASPDEWNVKDVLAHLIAGERDYHSWIAELINGEERLYDGFGDNVAARHAAVFASAPTLADLAADFKRAQRETTAMCASLPQSFLENRGSYWRLCFNFLQPPVHFHGHLDQIRASVEAARKN